MHSPLVWHSKRYFQPIQKILKGTDFENLFFTKRHTHTNLAFLVRSPGANQPSLQDESNRLMDRLEERKKDSSKQRGSGVSPGLGAMLLTLTLHRRGHAFCRNSAFRSPPRLMACCRSSDTSTGSSLNIFSILLAFCL